MHIHLVPFIANEQLLSASFLQPPPTPTPPPLRSSESCNVCAYHRHQFNEAWCSVQFPLHCHCHIYQSFSFYRYRIRCNYCIRLVRTTTQCSTTTITKLCLADCQSMISLEIIFQPPFRNNVEKHCKYVVEEYLNVVLGIDPVAFLFRDYWLLMYYEWFTFYEW